MEQGTCRLGEGECSKVGAITRGWCQRHYQRLRTTGKLTTKRIMNDDEDRFWSKVDRRGDDECWPWTGSTDGNGYGIFTAEGHGFRAHRWAYEHFVRDLPEDKPLIDHACHSRADDCGGGVCHHRRCVNFLPGKPGAVHLEPVTKLVNCRRAHRTDFSNELIIALYGRWAVGEPISAMALEAGMTPAALKGRFDNLEKDPPCDLPIRANRRPRRLTPELVASLYLRYEARESLDALAAEIGMNESSIRYQFRQRGLKLRPLNTPRGPVAREKVLRRPGTKLSDELIAVLYARWRGGESVAVLAREVEVCKSALRRRFRRIPVTPPDGMLF